MFSSRNEYANNITGILGVYNLSYSTLQGWYGLRDIFMVKYWKLDEIFVWVTEIK